LKLWSKIPERGRHITQEPQIIAPHLLGAPLATFRRRAAAFVLDVVLFGFLIGVLFSGLTVLSFHRQDPTLFPRLQQLKQDDSPVKTARNQLLLDFFFAMQVRCPDMLPPELQSAVVNRDPVGFVSKFNQSQMTIGFGSGPTTLTREDETYVLSVGTDLLLGRFSSVFSWGAFFIGWFTLWNLLGRGRTPGKFLLRLRVIRLDGKPLGWWGSFARAGGYGASAATIFLGFLEAIWHPNRQAMHDKIAGTVVLKG
jgi:hypothetical protein